MNLDKIVAISGKSGLFKAVGNRANGLIVEDLNTGERSFVPSRVHQFSPLEGIGIFIDTNDTVELGKVFQNMLDQLADNPPVDPKSSAEVLREYFLDVLPNHDPERVYVNDIRKIIKWFHFLNEKGNLTAEPPVKEEE